MDNRKENIQNENIQSGTMQKEKVQKENILQEKAFWKHLTERQKEQLLRESRFIQYESGDIIYSGVRECLGAILVQEGTLRTYLLSDEGKEITIYRLRKGDTCVLAASCVLSAITFDVEIEAQTFCNALLIPARILSAVTRENIYMENFVYQEAAKRFSDVVEALQPLLFLSLTQRVVSYLLDESAKNNAQSVFATHEEIAKVIGSAREAVSRTLKQLAKKEYIVLNRGEIKIEKKEELYRLL